MRISLIVFCLIISLSCRRKSTDYTNDTDSVIKIDLLTEPDSNLKKLSEFAENIEYIPLQTSMSSLLGSITRKIIYVENKIYIINEGLILCFDMKGKFLYKLEKSGRGPEEYTYLWDFDVSSDNKFLTILSYNKLLVYGISESGFVFQRSLRLKDPVPYKSRIVPETENVFLAIPPWMGTEPTLSLLINTFGDTIHFKPNCYKYKMERQRNSRGLTEMQVYSIGKIVCFNEEFSDTVFYIDSKDNFFKPRIILNSHGTVTSPEIRGGSKASGKGNFGIHDIFETSRYVFYWLTIMDNQDQFHESRIFFDKKTKTKYKLNIESSNSKLKDDLSGGPDFNIHFNNFYCSGGKLFSMVEALTLKKYVAGEDFKNAKLSESKKEGLKKLADSLKETDNPVLIIVTPKN